MKEYTVVNILDMLEAIGEENLSAILSDFSCPINKEIENFVWHNAIEFAKKKMSITYFLMDAEGEIAAIFTLTHKAVEIGNADISSTMRRKLSRYAQLDGNTNSYTVSAFLIAQFRKNYGFKGNLELSGNALMDDAFENAEWKEVLMALDEKYRVVVLLYYIEGLSTVDISKVLGLSESAVRSRLSRARKRLEQELE